MKVKVMTVDEAVKAFSDKRVGFGITTTSLKMDRAKIATVQFYDGETGVCGIVPVHVKDEVISLADWSKLAKLISTIEAIGHYMQFVCSACAVEFEVVPRISGDTYLLARVQQLPKQGLQDIALSIWPDKLAGKLRTFEEVFGDASKGNLPFETFDLEDEEQRKYMALGAALPYLIQEYYMESGMTVRWKAMYLEAYWTELMFLSTIIKDRVRGICVDLPRFQRELPTLEEQVNSLGTEFTKLAGRAVKYRSPKDLQKLLFNDLGLESKLQTDTGNPSTSAEAIEMIVDSHPILPVLLKLKHADSVFRAAQKIPDYVDFAGICRPQIEQIGFDGTARVYTSNPSVNQWPWEVRSAVVPHPGHKFVFFDWSAAELVLAAYWAKCSDLIERYERGEDLHRYISSCVLGKDDITDEEREVSKIVVFATIFGSEGDAPARALNISREEGEALVQRFLRIFPEIADLRDSVVGGCKETGYTMNYFGRIRQLPGILSDIPEEHEKARRQAFNTAIQGGTADCAKRAVIKLKKYAEEGVHYILSVFDSFLLEVPEDMPEYRIVDIVSDMCQMDDFRFRAKYGVGHTWLECKENEKPLIPPQE